MNNLYFACRDCKTFIDAGYRWAYWELEVPGTVERGNQVRIDSVLQRESYWNPPQEEGSRWLIEEVFPPLRQFLEDHVSHHIIFGEEEQFAPFDSSYLDWMQIGYMMQLTPRYLVEILEFRTWEQVIERVQNQRFRPFWWECTSEWEGPTREKGRLKFEELVRSTTCS